MKCHCLPSFEICNSHGREIIVDLMLFEAANGDRTVQFFTPGTQDPADDIPTEIDEFVFETAEMDAWWDEAARLETERESFLDSVINLIQADEQREDASFAARSIREYFVDILNRPDPLGTMKNAKIQERLEYLRGELKAERISLEELAELQQLAPHIDPSDVELLEAAGVPENDEADNE